MNRLLEFVWGTPKRALATTTVLVLALAAMLIGLPALRDVTAWFVPAAVIGFFVRQYPNESKQMFGRALEHLSWTSQAVEREAVRQDIEGTLAMGAGRLAQACRGATVANVRLHFIKSGEQVADLPDGTLVIAIAHHRDRANNLATAAWAFARHGVLRFARPHLDPDLSKGIDFVVAKQILSSADRDALRHFVEEVWQPAIKDADRLKRLTTKLERLQEDELLAPVLFTELHELGTRQTNRLPNDGIAAETADFVDLLFDVSEREHGQGGPMEFEGQAIRCKFIFVARADVYAVRGPDPYRKAVDWSIEHGYRNIYLLARGRHTGYAVEVAEMFDDDNRVFEPVVWMTSVSRNDRFVARAVVRIPVDVHYFVGIGQRPIVAVGPGRPGVARGRKGAQRRQA
jgi:hypothetical protein